MLNVKRKKKLKLFWFLVVLFLFWEVHGWFYRFSGVEVKNIGVSFGWNGGIISLLNLGLLAWLTWFGYKRDFVGVDLILIGGWTNMLDRLFFGYVRDYWWLGPVYNNIADWIISIGVGVFVWEIWKKK